MNNKIDGANDATVRDRSSRKLIGKAAADRGLGHIEGKKIKAGFVRLQGDSVILRMPANAQEVPYPLSKLDAASQQQAKDSAQ